MRDGGAGWKVVPPDVLEADRVWTDVRGFLPGSVFVRSPPGLGDRKGVVHLGKEWGRLHFSEKAVILHTELKSISPSIQTPKDISNF